MMGGNPATGIDCENRRAVVLRPLNAECYVHVTSHPPCMPHCRWNQRTSFRIPRRRSSFRIPRRRVVTSASSSSSSRGRRPIHLAHVSARAEMILRKSGAEPLRMYCWADFLFNFVFLNMFTSGTNNEFETSALLPIPLNWILKVSVVTYSLGPRKNVVLIF